MRLMRPRSRTVGPSWRQCWHTCWLVPSVTPIRSTVSAVVQKGTGRERVASVRKRIGA
jgi:hypothetical protein